MSKLMAFPLISFIVLLMTYSAIAVAPEQTSRPYLIPESSKLGVESEAEVDSEWCKGEWKSPQTCNTYNCDYKANWEYIDANDEIMFTISTKNRNKWTGIGFSENQAMPETDAILGLVEESGRFFLMDSWLRAYEAPPLDQSQNLYNMSAWRENGITTLRFFRKRITGDNRDFQFSDTNCPYLVFPVMGGVFNAVNKRIRKHESTPIISDRKVCIRSCKPSTATTASVNTSGHKDKDQTIKANDETSIAPTLQTTQIPNQSKAKEIEENNDNSYRIELKFPGIWRQSLGHKNSNEYKTMVSNIKQQMLNELISNNPSFNKLDVKELTAVESESNAMIASIDLEVKPNENMETYSLLSTALSAIISDELLGELRVDPKYLMITRKDEMVDSVEKELGIDFWKEDKIKWYIIFVGIAALIGLVLIQAICMLCRDTTNKDKESKNDKQPPNSQWKDYAAVSTVGARSGYGYDNYGASDETDAQMKTNGQSLGRSEKLNSSKQLYKNSDQMSHKYLSATLERQPSRSQRTNEFTSAYATHDRKDQYNRHYNQPSFSPQLQPDFYFMPHQRRYSGEVVRVFVDYNSPQFAPK